MRLAFVSCLLTITCMLCSCHTSGKTFSSTDKPNIIYILADDLGFGELGIYGQKIIETPHLDALGRNGKVFMQHYTSAPVCAPARYMLLTGKHAGHSYIRGNDEWRERGEVWDFKKAVLDSTLEGQRPIPENEILFPFLLQKNGYLTSIFGKWGLGAPHTNSIPTKMGFDYFYGYNCQRQAHTYYPVHLYENEAKVQLNNALVIPNTKLQPDQDPLNPVSYLPFNQKDYAPDLMFDKMLNFIDKNKEKPFFIYWATPIPHNPIQAPEKWVKFYQNKIGQEKPYLGQNGYFPHPSPRAGYAAQISYLDEQVGLLVEHLKKTGLYEKTVILFSSDNGATFSGGTDAPYFNSNGPYDEAYGKGKGFVYEGGIKVPFIVHWPKQVKSGINNSLVSSQYDMYATLLEIAGVKNIPKTDGISLCPTIFEKGVQKDHDFLLWVFPEYGGQVAIRLGKWKLIRQNLKDPKNKPTLELYDLSKDPNEKENIAANYPDIIQKMSDIFQHEHTVAEIDRFRIPLVENGLTRTE